MAAKYVAPKPLEAEKCVEDLRAQFDILFKQDYDNFHLFLITYARARQLNPLKTDLLSEEQLQKISNHLQGLLKYYQLITLLLGGYLLPNNDYLKSYLDQYGSAYKTFAQWFNQDTLLTKLEKISESELSDILKKPSKENLNELLCKLDIPANGFKVNLKRSPKEIPKLVGNNDSLGLFYYFQNHSTPAAVFNQMHQCPWASDTAAFTDFRKRCIKQREILKERYSIFEKIKAAHYPSETQPAVFSEHFPVVFVTESAHIEPYCMEYRSRFPLKLGVNIHLIATDTEEHRKEIEQYLVEKCNLQNVEVILIDKLRDPSFRPKIREISPEIMAIEQSQKPPPQPAEIVEELIIPDITEEQGVPDTEPKATNTISMMVLSGFISALGGLAVALAFTLLNAAALTLAGVLVAGAGVLAIGAGLASLGFFAYQHRATISPAPLEPNLQSP